nr:Uncharacterised protein [Klebsiella pneumoniae]
MMTGFREQGSGIPLTLLHGISSGAASGINRWRYPATACWPGICPVMAKARCWRRRRRMPAITPTRWRECWTALE